MGKGLSLAPLVRGATAGESQAQLDLSHPHPAFLYLSGASHIKKGQGLCPQLTTAPSSQPTL